MKKLHGFTKGAAKHPKGTHPNVEPVSYTHKIPSMTKSPFHKTRKKRLTQLRRHT